MDEHPSMEELCRFAEGTLPRERAHGVVSHILRGCQSCGEEAARRNLLHLRRRAGTGHGPGRGGYGTVIERAFSTVQHLASVVGREPEELQDPREIVQGLEGAALVDSLLARSWSLRYQDSAEMVRFARAAVLAALEMRPETLGERALADLRCRAWADLGNAYRVNDELSRAEDALSRSAELIDRGSGAPALKSRLYELQASLFSAQRSFDQAQAALDVAYSIYFEQGEFHMAGRVLISKASHAGYSHQPHEAARLTGQGLALLDETADPDLFFIASHNQLWFLVECFRFQEALDLLAAHRPLRAKGRLNALKLLWLEGRIAAGLDELPLAPGRLNEARLGFESAGLRYRASLVALDLAAVLLRLGRPQEARNAVATATEVFAELEISRESLLATQVLRTALQIETTPLLLVTRIADLLRQSALGLDHQARPQGP